MAAPEVSLREEAFAALDRLTEEVPGGLGIALSGGSDSTALSVIVADWAREREREVAAATVDHHLRPESTEEATRAGLMAKGLGLDHKILDWFPDATTPRTKNLPARARHARHRLLGDWCRERGFGAVLLGHTQDDQAETVLMRLFRGSGADGLSGMGDTVELEEMLWLRPLLTLRRDALRDFLNERGIGWTDDPTNDDVSYDRARIRQAMAVLNLAPEGLALTAETLARQCLVLEQDRNRLAEAAVTIGSCGDIRLSPIAFDAAEEDTSMAVLADAITWIGGLVYRPRFQSLTGVWQSEGVRTLGGVLSLRSETGWTLCRELIACAGPTPLAPGIWDNRWKISGPDRPDLTLRALGEEGLSELKKLDHKGPNDWEGTVRPAQMVVPSVWQGDTLICVPAAGFHHEESPQDPPIEAHLTPLPARFSRSESL